MNKIIDINPDTATPIEYDRFGWLQRHADQEFTDFDSMVPYLQGRSLCAETTDANNNEITFDVIDRPTSRDEMNSLGVYVDGKPVGFTHWSFGQMASLAKSPAGYLRSLPAQLVRDCLEYSLRFVREVEGIKLYADHQELRAVTGPGYGRIDDAEVAIAARTIVDEGAWEPAADHMGFRVTDRALNMFLIDKSNPVVVGKTPRGDDDVYYRGLRISNSEVGGGSLWAEGFMFRSYCTNGCIFGLKEAEKVTVRHTKNAPYRWAREVQPAIEHYASADNQSLVEAIERTKDARIAQDDDAMINWLNNRGLSKTQAREAIDRIEVEEQRRARTVWDAVQGITSLARDCQYVEDRVAMERIAGNMFEKAAA